MAAAVLLRCGRGFVSLLYGSPRYSTHSPSPLKDRIIQYLCNRFYDIEAFVDFGSRLKQWNIQRKNEYLNQAHEVFGDDLSAAIFVLALKGGIKFQGEEEWFRETSRKKHVHHFIECQGLPLEAVDVSGSVIMYEGLDNLVNLKALKHLDLSRCPNIDDWSLSRLHVFRDSLQELSLAGCPQVTEKGLACLHHLENLKRLDVSDLPSVPNQGLIGILLEEMLPQCDVVGMNYSDGICPAQR